MERICEGKNKGIGNQRKEELSARDGVVLQIRSGAVSKISEGEVRRRCIGNDHGGRSS